MSDLVDDFQENDLLYGQTNDRLRYLDSIGQKFNNANGDYTIDRLTRSCSLKSGFKNNWSVDELIKNTHPEAYLPEDAQEFYKFAKQSRFAAKLHNKTLSNPVTKLGNVPKGSPLTKPFLRSKCKAGIEFVIQRGFNIRFVIDSLDETVLSKIYNKELEQPWYTGVELRYIRKNWARLKDRVVFYRNGIRCVQPWTEEAGEIANSTDDEGEFSVARNFERIGLNK